MWTASEFVRLHRWVWTFCQQLSCLKRIFEELSSIFSLTTFILKLCVYTCSMECVRVSEKQTETDCHDKKKNAVLHLSF